MNTITLNVAGISGTYRETHHRPASYREAVALARKINADGFDVQIVLDGRVHTDTGAHTGCTSGTYKPVHVVTYCDVTDSLYPRSLGKVNRNDRTVKNAHGGNEYGTTRERVAAAIREARRAGRTIAVADWIMDGYCISYGCPMFRRTRTAALA